LDYVQTAIYVTVRTSPRRLRIELASNKPIEGDEATWKMVDRILGALGGNETKENRPL